MFFSHGDLRQCIAVFPVPIFFVELQSLPISSTCSNRSSRRSQSIPARRLANQHVKLSMFTGSSSTGATHTYIYISVCIHVSYHIENITLQCSFTNIISVILYIYVPSRQLILSCTAHICPGPLWSPCPGSPAVALLHLPHKKYQVHDVSSILYLVVLLDLDGYYITLHYIILYHIILYYIISNHIILYYIIYTQLHIYVCKYGKIAGGVQVLVRVNAKNRRTECTSGSLPARERHDRPISAPVQPIPKIGVNLG